MEHLQLSLDLTNTSPLELEDFDALEEALEPEPTSEELACAVCNGSGEGAYGGSCYACHGSGTHDYRSFYN